MNENIKKWISIFIATIILFLMMYSCGTIVKAEVPIDHIVIKNTATWGVFDFIYNAQDAYYTIPNPAGLEICSSTAPYYYYTDDNITFKRTNGVKTFTYVLNNLVGIIPNPSNLSSIFTAWCVATGVLDSINGKYIKQGLYDLNDNFYGYCLNDISGCYYNGVAIETDSIKDDGNYSNNVNNYIRTHDISECDYFTFYPLSNNYILRNLGSSLSQNQLDQFNQITQTQKFTYGVYHNDNTGKTKFYGEYNQDDNKFTVVDDVSYLVYGYGTAPENQRNYNLWNNFTKKCVENNECLATDLIDVNISLNIPLVVRDSNGNNLTSGTKYDLYNDTSTSMTIRYSYTELIYNSFILGSNYDFMPFNVDKITIYKNPEIKNEFDTQLYTPSVYYTDAYNNYDSNNDNSLNASVQIVDNSTQYNSSIYDASSESFYNYYSNDTYDQSSATTNITNITNNYYNGGSDNPDNPDNPDDNSTLDEILRAILRFFNAIGDIIGTLLASIINLIDSVLESLSGVMENLDGMSDFFSSLFAWIPEPVPAVLGAGFGICLVCGIIKFIRG